MKQFLASGEGQPFAGEGEQFEFGRFDLRKQRNAA